MNVLIAGDFCPHNRVVQIIEEGRYPSLWRNLHETLDDYDYTIVNFECPVVENEVKPIEKIGPCLKCSSKAVESISYVGFNCVTLANNHFYDYGDEGVEDTINSLNNSKIDFVGGGRSLEEASNTLYKRINGETLAIINCCEHEFSIATKSHGGSNPLNILNQYKKIKEAKERADYVVVIVHGGIEHFQLPTPRMKEIYRFFISVGADAVINHHQHCFSGYEIYKGSPIFYGLGNFCFDWEGRRNSQWNEGYLVGLFFSKAKTTSFDIIPFCQCDSIPAVVILQEKKHICQKIASLNIIIEDENLLESELDSYIRSKENNIISYLMPFGNKYVRGLCRRLFFSKGISHKKMILLKNLFNCESHYEILKEYFKLSVK